jgi:ribosome-associated protein
MPRDADDIEPQRPSKSERKRAMHRLQDLGQRLADLAPETLARLPIGAPLREALLESRRITGREARRRQLQYLGKLMRAEDADAVAQALEALRADGQAERRRQHQLERWRERLIEQGDAALDEFVSHHPAADRQQLRQLARAARRERAAGQPPTKSRRLFRALREIIRAG